MHLAEVGRRLSSSQRKKGAKEFGTIISVCAHRTWPTTGNRAAQETLSSCTLCSAAEIRSPAHAGHAFSAAKRRAGNSNRERNAPTSSHDPRSSDDARRIAGAR